MKAMRWSYTHSVGQVSASHALDAEDVTPREFDTVVTMYLHRAGIMLMSQDALARLHDEGGSPIKNRD